MDVEPSSAQAGHEWRTSDVNRAPTQVLPSAAVARVVGCADHAADGLPPRYAGNARSTTPGEMDKCRVGGVSSLGNERGW
jgi:hypothetical protein